MRFTSVGCSPCVRSGSRRRRLVEKSEFRLHSEYHHPNTELVAAGAFPAPPGRGGGEGARPRFDDLPAFCRVTATAKPTSGSEIKIEVWLPTEWNGKLRGTGNGGLGGGAGVNVGALAAGVSRRLCDGGH